MRHERKTRSSSAPGAGGARARVGARYRVAPGER